MSFNMLEDELPRKLTGKSIGKPIGTLAGHASGLGFEGETQKVLLELFGKRAFRHFEYLNEILEKNASALTSQQRLNLFGPKSLQSLICRGKSPMGAWSSKNLFEEKQDDTAESIILGDNPDEPITLLDVKSHNLDKKSQQPNIISAKKLVKALSLALNEGSVPFTFVYVGIGWRVDGNTLKAENVRVVELFKIPPSEIYTNWAAATQIQFDTAVVAQNFEGTAIAWARQFLEVYCSSLENRIEKETKEVGEIRRIIAGSAPDSNGQSK